MGMSPRLLRPRATGFNPKSIAGLSAWFDADDVSTFTLSGTAVAEWRDKSGNGYAVSQSTGNNQPARTGAIRGRACIDFDGTNDVLFSDGTGLSAVYDGDKSVTVFVVGEMHSAAERAINDLGTWFSFGSSVSGTPFAYFRSSAGAATLQVAIRNDASNASGGLTAVNQGPASSGSTGNGDFYICSFSLPSQAVVTARVHTVLTNVGDSLTSPRNQQGLTTTSLAARAAGTTTSNRFAVGALGRNSFSDYYPGRLSEILIYSRVVTDSERARIVKWMGQKYNNSETPVL